ncbi:hypothetical protein E5J99_20290 [Hymenobacter elongatus]|uniref:Transposase IS701-like DDE domain-containing protein n=1 Tax=Hymenobacter elongatus TaxID=877208 RepID=A0A4Z0PEF1_9BACT|nr:hypothetical protein [Hymenobacter elongatus]TGE12418.1 hypothetical protein E5J99_20290 [Hymenobacter elongatus]
MLNDSPEAFLPVDDSVQDKRYGRLIEVAKRQYSGDEHGLVTGICLVNLAHSSGKPGDFLPLDYRVYAPTGWIEQKRALSADVHPRRDRA